MKRSMAHTSFQAQHLLPLHGAATVQHLVDTPQLWLLPCTMPVWGGWHAAAQVLYKSRPILHQPSGRAGV